MKNIGMIGVGNMASALAKVIHEAGFQLLLFDHHREKLNIFKETLSAEIVLPEQLPQMLATADLIYIGVKPNQLRGVFAQIQPQLPPNKVLTWVSMVAGVSLADLADLTPAEHSWIRMMPNTPVKVNEGCIAYAASANVPAEKLSLFQDSLRTSGLLAEVDETLFPAITGLSGSGPAFIYQLIEAMSDVGVSYGLPRNLSLELAAQTVRGAATMVLDCQEHPAVLKDQVTSPGGTTIAGIRALEEAGFRSAIMQGIAAAIEKSQKLI